MAPPPRSSRFQPLPLLPTVKLGLSIAGSRVGGLVHTLGPVWVSPTNSPVRLGVSPAAASASKDVFNQRFEALFPCAGALGCAVCLAPCCSSWFIYALMWGCGMLPTALPALFSATLSPALSAYLCECGTAASASGRTAGPVGPTLRQSRPATATRVLSAKAARLCPSYWSG